MATAQRQKIESLQILRACAALMVVATHASIQLQGSFRDRFPDALLWLRDFGSTGVDIFFVISGFIMLYSTRGLPASRQSIRVFYLRRLIRIIPLYWLATTFIITLWESGLLSRTAYRPMSDIISSYLFLPVFNNEGNLRPILGVGWTLIYEMFFYFIFGFVLLAKIKNRFHVASVVMMAFIVCGVIIPPQPETSYLVYTSPLLLEFILGVWIAHLFISNQNKFPLAATVFIHILSWIVLAVSAADQERTARLIFLGIPSALIVWSALQIERSFGGWGRIAIFSKLGDSSYSLYLLHPIILIGFAFLSRRLQLPEILSATTTFFVILLLVAIAANLAFRFIERPLTAWLNTKVFGDPPGSPAKQTT